jgi:hypothetical protein
MTMKRLYRLTAVAAGLLLAGRPTVAPAQDAPQNHDFQFMANLGAQRIVAQTKTGVLSTNAPVFVQLTAANITIPAGQTGFLVTTFSGESLCTGPAGAWCSLIVTVNGVESHPIVGNNFAFDAVGSGDLWESHSIQRISNRLPAGVHVVELKWAVVGNATFSLDDWLMKVELWRAS